jgi:hypothetical protein
MGAGPRTQRRRLLRGEVSKMTKYIAEHKQFGRLIAQWPIGKTKRGMLVWMCSCICGNILPVRYGNLQSGHTVSCGCAHIGCSSGLQHGHSAPSRGGRSPEYYSYSCAKERCQNSKNHNYPHYGAAGVKFLFASFEAFYAELGPRPKGTTCDRYPNPAGNYAPSNVRWATPLQQRHNRRTK